jgi:hypothetical protein
MTARRPGEDGGSGVELLARRATSAGVSCLSVRRNLKPVRLPRSSISHRRSCLRGAEQPQAADWWRTMPPKGRCAALLLSLLSRASVRRVQPSSRFSPLLTRRRAAPRLAPRPRQPWRRRLRRLLGHAEPG